MEVALVLSTSVDLTVATIFDSIDLEVTQAERNVLDKSISAIIAVTEAIQTRLLAEETFH